MTRARGTPGRRERGNLEWLPSGAIRVRVYAGIDPVTKQRHYLKEVIPPGPAAERQAQATRERMVREVEERRNPRTSATLRQLLDRYLDQLDAAPRTRELYRGYIRTHIEPLIGHLKVSTVDAEVLDSFYAELRRCRDHCRGRSYLQHRTRARHKCDERCHAHVCRPLGTRTVRHMHFRRYTPRHVREDMNDPDAFRPHLVAIARMEAPAETDGGQDWIDEYELEVREHGDEDENPVLTLRWQARS